MLLMADALASHGLTVVISSGATLGMYKLIPFVAGWVRTRNGNGGGNGGGYGSSGAQTTAFWELKIKETVAEQMNISNASLVQSVNRMEAALTRMEGAIGLLSRDMGQISVLIGRSER